MLHVLFVYFRHGYKKKKCFWRIVTIVYFQMLEIEYFVDGLLSCATDACITVFTKCVQEQQVSWFTSRYFLYDLSLNHEPNEESVLLVLVRYFFMDQGNIILFNLEYKLRFFILLALIKRIEMIHYDQDWVAQSSN